MKRAGEEKTERSLGCQFLVYELVARSQVGVVRGEGGGVSSEKEVSESRKEPTLHPAFWNWIMLENSQ